jgi:hypothetical protein
MWLSPLWLTFLPVASSFSSISAPAAFISNAFSKNLERVQNANPATTSALFVATIDEPTTFEEAQTVAGVKSVEQ